MCIIAKEVVEQYGDLKKSEACIGTGPWMLERYESGARMTWVRHPYYFLPGLPYADQVEGRVHPDPSSRLASWLAGGYDFGPEYLNVVRRADLDIVRQRKPALKTAEFLSPVGAVAVPKLGQEPFKDVRVRRAMMRANSWKEILESNALAEGHGAPNPAVPAALREWAIPVDQLPPEGRKLYEQDPADAKRLLAAAGYPNGFKVPLETSGGFGLDFMDAVQIVQRNWKAIGIESDLKLKEVGAFVSSSIYGRFDKLMMMIRGGLVYPDPYLVHQYMPGQPLNAAGVDDPKLTEMIRLQRRTFDVSSAARSSTIFSATSPKRSTTFWWGRPRRSSARGSPTSRTSRRTSGTTTAAVSWRPGSTADQFREVAMGRLTYVPRPPLSDHGTSSGRSTRTVARTRGSVRGASRRRGGRARAGAAVVRRRRHVRRRACRGHLCREDRHARPGRRELRADAEELPRAPGRGRPHPGRRQRAAADGRRRCLRHQAPRHADDAQPPRQGAHRSRWHALYAAAGLRVGSITPIHARSVESIIEGIPT
jgi:hypothetical protein